jgi:predicted transcriptional regulator
MVTHAIPVDAEAAKAIEELAKRAGRSLEDVATDAVRDYVEHAKRVLASIEQGKRDIQAGRVHSLESVLDDVSRQRATTKR